ncbi:MAG TPA: hypothetical protein VHU42_01115 [Rhodopila sp.]|jgi:hypothetical protein|nr:hypothetical protein [Rhodopila sp.]
MSRRLIKSLRHIVLSSLPLLSMTAYGAFPGRFSAMPGPQVPTVGQTVMTPRGPAFVTGSAGAMATTTVPGTGRQGFLINNNNGTSTLIQPGGAPEVVATPR